MKIITATKKSFEVAWAGVATIDGALRFELIGVDLQEVFTVFSDKNETENLTHDWDGQTQTFYRFTNVKTIDVQPNGNVVVALSKR